MVDKDYVAEMLARRLGADRLLMLTDVDHVALDFGTPTQRNLTRISADEARRHQEAGQFPPGSMGPKMEACIRFIKWGGRRATITSLDNAVDAIDGKTGTHIVP